jgi:hypothetical protein
MNREERVSVAAEVCILLVMKDYRELHELNLAPVQLHYRLAHLRQLKQVLA